MKTKIIALFAVLALAFVGLNTTSCSKDSDSDSTSTNSNTSATTDSFSLGKTDGTAFANAYTAYKATNATIYSKAEAINTMLRYGTRYRNSNDKAYKTGFIAAATGATGLAESQLTNLLGSQSEDALITLLKSLTGTTSSAKVGSDI